MRECQQTYRTQQSTANADRRRRVCALCDFFFIAIGLMIQSVTGNAFCSLQLLYARH